MCELTDRELLNYAIENGIISRDNIQEQIEMNERKRYLEQHNYEIWKGKDERYYTYLPDKHTKSGRKLLKRTNESSIENAIVDYYKNMANEPYIEDVFNMWIDSKLKYGEIQRQTYDRYSTDYERYIRKTLISEIEFRFITEDLLEEFIKTTIHSMNLTSKAWSGLRTLINGIFKYGKKKGYTKISITSFMGDLDLSKNIFTKKYIDDRLKVFTSEEENLIADYICNQKPSLLLYGVLLSFQTGMRIGELSSLEWNDIDGNSIKITKTEIRYKDNNGKYVFEVRDFPKTDAGNRNIIITKKTIELLQKIKNISGSQNGYIFCKSGKRMHGHAFTDKLYRICDDLGIQRRSAHKARMTYGTHLIDAGVPDNITISQMGHTDIKTTRAFYYYNNKSKEEAERIIERAFSA
jgi:integrase|nr:MAG TPA: Integrase [Bacteriophage sp.]